MDLKRHIEKDDQLGKDLEHKKRKLWNERIEDLKNQCLTSGKHLNLLYLRNSLTGSANIT